MTRLNGAKSHYYPATTKENLIEPAEGAATFKVTGSDYDRFMGRYSAKLAVLFADTVDLSPPLGRSISVAGRVL